MCCGPNSSPHVEDTLNSWLLIFGRARVHSQVVEDLREAAAVSVAAEHGHLVVRMFAHDCREPFAHCATSEVRQVLIRADLSFVPASLAKRRHMRKDQQ